MKKIYSLFSVIFLLTVMASCTEDTDMFENAGSDPSFVQESMFPEEDDSQSLRGSTGVAKVRYLLEAVGPEFATKLGISLKIEESQIQEIKTFTDNLVADCATEKDKFYAIYNYVGDNINYAHQGYVDNDPYPVFVTKQAVCQGYANLLKVMCYTQNIPCLVVNGNLFHGGIFYGAHAWNYAYADGAWYVCDPTNKSTVGGGPYSIKSSIYVNNLKVFSIDAVLFEDENFTYTFTNEVINVNSVKSSNSQVIVPFSTNGYKITSFNPTVNFPDEVKELIIGKNIETLGREDYIIGISHYANKLESIYIDPENEYYESNSNVVYQKVDGTYKLTFIAPMVKEVVLKPIIAFGKDNSIKYHDNLESIVFSPGTKYIDDYSVEFCKNLHTAYIPDDTEVSSKAFDGVASDFKIVRGDYTNVPEIKAE